jgi:hypothetical protein
MSLPLEGEIRETRPASVPVPLTPSIILALVLCEPGGDPPAGSTPAEQEGSEEGSRIEVAILDVHGLDGGRFGAALSLRAPGLIVRDHAPHEPLPTEPHVFVHIEPTRGDPASYKLLFLVSDGRAYERTIEVEPADAERIVASHLANLVQAIESGTIAPDREGVTVQDVLPEQESPSDDEDAAPGDSQAPVAASPSPAEGWDEHSSRSVDVAIHSRLLAGVGLGAPNDVDRFIGWGGAFGSMVRFANGAALLLDGRFLTRREIDGFRMRRIRVAIGGGWVHRRDSLEVVTTLAATVEPWWVSERRRRQGFVDRDAVPLLGGALAVAPGWYLRPPRRGVALRLGLRLELAASTLANRFGTVRVAVDEGAERRSLFRAGGVEILAGIDFALWLGAAFAAR